MFNKKKKNIIINNDPQIINYNNNDDLNDLHKPINNNNNDLNDLHKPINNIIIEVTDLPKPINNNEKIDNNVFLKELLNNQLKNLNINKKLNYNDIKRISKFLTKSIFHKDECALWNGYITNEKNQSKGTYINFYFNKKKIALHRLLYNNYIGEISNDEYIKFSCNNKGKCCNINHMKKYSYIKNINDVSILKNDINNGDIIHINLDKNKLIIEL